MFKGLIIHSQDFTTIEMNYIIHFREKDTIILITLNLLIEKHTMIYEVYKPLRSAIENRL